MFSNDFSYLAFRSLAFPYGSASGGRLECTMQSIAENFLNTYNSRCSEGIESMKLLCLWPLIRLLRFCPASAVFFFFFYKFPIALCLQMSWTRSLYTMKGKGSLHQLKGKGNRQRNHCTRPVDSFTRSCMKAFQRYGWCFSVCLWTLFSKVYVIKTCSGPSKWCSFDIFCLNLWILFCHFCLLWSAIFFISGSLFQILLHNFILVS